jgi:hypothetical protein
VQQYRTRRDRVAPEPRVPHPASRQQSCGHQRGAELSRIDKPLPLRAAVKYTSAEAKQPWGTCEKLSLSAALAQAQAAVPRCNPEAVKYALVLAFGRDADHGGIQTGERDKPIDPQSWDWSRIDNLHWAGSQFRLIAEKQDYVLTNVQVCSRGLALWCGNAEAEVANAFAEAPPKMGWYAQHLRERREMEDGANIQPAPAPATTTKRKKGPTPGGGTYPKLDRQLYPEVTRLMDEGYNLTNATLKLAADGRVAGQGTTESIATRLRRRFSSEVGHGPTRSH